MKNDEWISVAERLPEADTDVLTWSNWGIRLAWRHADTGAWHEDIEPLQADEIVTHWMPLPEPPK